MIIFNLHLCSRYNCAENINGPIDNYLFLQLSSNIKLFPHIHGYLFYFAITEIYIY